MYIIRLTLKLALLVSTCLLAKKIAKRIQIDKHERINIDTNKNDDMMLQITIELIIIALNIALIPL